MTKQEAFDKMVAHLATQKQRSVDKDGKCLYRGLSDMKCAIGALLSDETYKRLVEDKIQYQDLDAIFDDVSNDLALEDDENPCAFYDRMQRAHDSSVDLSDLKRRLHVAADEHKLDPSGIASITSWSYGQQ